MPDDVSDPTDWNNTALPFFAQYDAGLRCQVCKDFFTSAVITACSHTFCSLCIRRCLGADGKCPTCRTTEQEVRLRRNVAVQELTDAFVASRPEALKVAQAKRSMSASPDSSHGSSGRKRKRNDVAADTRGTEPTTRRRSSRLQNTSQTHDEDEGVQSGREPVRAPEEDGDDDYQPEDGLVPCPICHKRMKPEAVFEHLDQCDGEPPSDSKPRRISKTQARSRTSTPLQDQNPPKPPPERLPQINYSLLKDNALRKKLSDLSISASGPRQLLMRCLLYTSPSPRDGLLSRMPSSA